MEPENADCIARSLDSGTLTRVTGGLQTIMAGLACGEVSLLAWEILKECTLAAMTISDTQARDAMQLLARAEAASIPVVAGESAVAGMAGLLATTSKAWCQKALSINQNSRILLIGSEGATDKASYQSIVGETPEAILKAGWA